MRTVLKWIFCLAWMTMAIGTSAQTYTYSKKFPFGNTYVFTVHDFKDYEDNNLTPTIGMVIFWYHGDGTYDQTEILKPYSPESDSISFEYEYTHTAYKQGNSFSPYAELHLLGYDEGHPPLRLISNQTILPTCSNCGGQPTPMHNSLTLEQNRSIVPNQIVTYIIHPFFDCSESENSATIYFEFDNSQLLSEVTTGIGGASAPLGYAQAGSASMGQLRWEVADINQTPQPIYIRMIPEANLAIDTEVETSVRIEYKNATCPSDTLQSALRVTNSHDPNTLESLSDIDCGSPLIPPRVRYRIIFQNEGDGQADSVIVKMRIPDFFDRNSINVIAPSTPLPLTKYNPRTEETYWVLSGPTLKGSGDLKGERQVPKPASIHETMDTLLFDIGTTNNWKEDYLAYQDAQKASVQLTDIIRRNRLANSQRDTITQLTEKNVEWRSLIDAIPNFGRLDTCRGNNSVACRFFVSLALLKRLDSVLLQLPRLDSMSRILNNACESEDWVQTLRGLLQSPYWQINKALIRDANPNLIRDLFSDLSKIGALNQDMTAFVAYLNQNSDPTLAPLRLYMQQGRDFGRWQFRLNNIANSFFWRNYLIYLDEMKNWDNDLLQLVRRPNNIPLSCSPFSDAAYCFTFTHAVVSEAEIIFDANPPILTNLDVMGVACQSSQRCDEFRDEFLRHDTLFLANHGDNIQLDTSGIPFDFGDYEHFYWYPSIGLSDSTKLDPVVTAEKNTNYYLVLHDYDGGGSRLIIQFPIFFQSNLFFTDEVCIENGGFRKITATANNQYLWQNGQFGNSFVQSNLDSLQPSFFLSVFDTLTGNYSYRRLQLYKDNSPYVKCVDEHPICRWLREHAGASLLILTLAILSFLIGFFARKKKK
ncbi:MAG: hypothetical protein AAFV95_25840 [Bacteroidota bacterium]